MDNEEYFKMPSEDLLFAGEKIRSDSCIKCLP